ncbi:HNH endonuclease [Enterococcus malodoratus]|uniref:HNH endonuclease n=1 Tax=Enterococcus malodoratus TaxID=71451 RepID=UPI002074603E|nr:HNH endonuclease [Enterococcus malodoratus]
MTEEFYRWLVQLIRDDNLKKFYDCAKWRHLRQRAIKRDNHECQMCRAQGKYHQVNNVHHIKEVKLRPDLALDIDNLVCLCIDHHNEVHDRYVDGQGYKDKDFKNFDSSERW